ncbi:hypothetical protein LCGC14_1608680 [marine sediment metagenome]|uniref:Uncharacterized protein n=1 Tax=marine sediment metagenome TaxID=412755 RepID=A0A0F9KPV4_9ZZZZ
MPYIKQEKRKELEMPLAKLLFKLNSKGDYNYIITMMLHHFIEKNGLRYEHLNDAMGIVESAKQEFYRTVVAPYEDKKIEENGSISELDK